MKSTKERNDSMKRTKTSSILTATAAVAGLAMGASIAMAAHPPIQLFTYEEVATQYMGPKNPANPFAGPVQQMPVMVGANPSNPMQGMPYSPKQTCTGGGNLSCHSDGNTVGLKPYSKLADHAFHSQMGENEWMDNNSASNMSFIDNNGIQTGLNPQKPWLQSHGHNGKW
jgi:hypothetical protein